MLDDIRQAFLDAYDKALAKVGLRQIGVVLLSIGVFVAVAVWAYKTYYTDSAAGDSVFVTNKELISADDDSIVNGEAIVYYFYTTWCPYCKKSRPVWDKLKQWGHGRILGGKKIAFVEVDCDKKPKMAEQYKVDGYPTILLDSMGTVYRYDAAPRLKELKQFVTTSLITKDADAKRAASQVGSLAPFAVPVIAAAG